MTPKQDALRKKKLGLVHILKAQLIKSGELDEKGYRDTLARDYDAASSAELSIDQLEHFIKDMEALGGVITRRPRWSKNKQRIPVDPNDTAAAQGRPTKYESSIEGLRQEVCDLAKQRFGDGWEKPLNKLCMTSAEVHHWKFLNVAKAKIVREVILRLEAKGPYVRNPGIRKGKPERPDTDTGMHDMQINGGSYVW